MNARTTAGLALAAVAGLALSACSPQLEHPSDEKVDTATSQDADSVGTTDTTGTAEAEAEADVTATEAAAETEVLFIDCFGEAGAEPESVSTDCADPAAQITEITWESWGADQATGTGVGVDGAESTVELSQPIETGAATVFTVVTVDGAAVN